MALTTPQIQRFLLSKFHRRSTTSKSKTPHTNINSNTFTITNTRRRRRRSRCFSAIAIDAPSSLTDSPPIRWGSVSLQGPREEMEDDIVLRPNTLQGFSFAAVFDGHGGFSSVQFLRDELYKECLEALQGGLLLLGKDFKAVEEALKHAFIKADMRLLKWLELNGEEDESGATATAMFVGDNKLLISHVGDSSVVLCRSGKPELLTSPHRPYGSNKASLQEIKRIREAGGWIVNGRICGDISISRAFGDMRFKTKKNEMLRKGAQEGRWTEKFISRELPSPSCYHCSSDAVTFVRDQLRQHGNTQLACESLAQVVLDQQRTQDNVSIIIADLGKTDWQNVPLQQQNVILELVQAIATIGIVSIGVWFSSQLSL
uniref:protein-serine/threonine phosphatase n=1 Tax=Cicer arietinum TaxID=3827 RepID=A0A1S3E9B4_CICAR|nr:protein phosphatase 2C 57 isoform X2 [Cicer arietinum]